MSTFHRQENELGLLQASPSLRWRVGELEESGSHNSSQTVNFQTRLADCIISLMAGYKQANLPCHLKRLPAPVAHPAGCLKPLLASGSDSRLSPGFSVCPQPP